MLFFIFLLKICLLMIKSDLNFGMLCLCSLRFNSRCCTRHWMFVTISGPVGKLQNQLLYTLLNYYIWHASASLKYLCPLFVNYWLSYSLIKIANEEQLNWQLIKRTKVEFTCFINYFDLCRATLAAPAQVSTVVCLVWLLMRWSSMFSSVLCKIVICLKKQIKQFRPTLFLTLVKVESLL